MPGKTVVQKTGDWYSAFSVIREELTPPPVRSVLSEMRSEPTVEGIGALERLARLVAANDRAAALAAAILTAQGVRSISSSFEFVEEEEE